MVVTIHTKNCTLSNVTTEYLYAQVAKIEKLLQGFSRDIVPISLTAEWHDKKQYYEGKLTLSLKKKSFIAHASHGAMEKVISDLSEKMIREVRHYKGKHLKSHSDYPDRRSIRTAQV